MTDCISLVLKAARGKTDAKVTDQHVSQTYSALFRPHAKRLQGRRCLQHGLNCVFEKPTVKASSNPLAGNPDSEG